MPHPGRTDLTQLRLLDPAGHLASDAARTQRALDVLKRRLQSEARGPDTDQTPAVIAPAHESPAARRRRVRIGLAAAVAALTVAGVVVAVVAARPTARPRPTMPAELTLDTLVIGVKPDSGFRVTGVSTAVGTQTVDVGAASNPQTFAHVTLARTSSTPPTPISGRDPVDLGDGVTARWVAPSYGRQSLGPPQADVLSWDTSGFSFSVQTSVFDDDSTTVAVAHAVQLVPPTALQIPVRVPSLPAGGHLTGLSITDVDGNPDNVQNRFVTITIAVPGATRSDGSSPAINIDMRALDLKGDDETGPAVTIGGRTWRWDTNADTLTWHGPDRVVSVGPPGSSGPGPITTTALKAFVARLTFATSFQDTTTWFDAATALPS